MNTPIVGLPLSSLLPSSLKKKRVLLVDASHSKRDLRAEVMRKLGMDVDCAADIPEARVWWRADLYDLVLIGSQNGRGYRDKFCEDIRSATPPQRMAFLVGKPEYVSNSPGADEILIDETPQTNDNPAVGDVKAALSADVGNLNQRWGILEASRRISAVRSASTARTRAMRDRPVPARDSEGRTARKVAVSTQWNDVPREEMQ
jgi:CheY-like chemotaxis protein